MADLTHGDLELLHGKNFAHVATIGPGCSPHVTVTWVDEADGFVLVDTAAGRVKDRNVLRDPRVTVSVFDQTDPYRWLMVRGSVEERVVGDEAERFINVLSRKYTDEPWEYQPGQIRVLYRIRPERIARSG